MAQEIKADALAKSINKILDEYRNGVNSNVQKAVKSVARAGARELRRRSSRLFKSRDRHYANGWTAVIEADKHGATGTVWNKAAPGLVHLLGNGHANRYGGFTNGKPHVAPVEQKIVEDFEKEVAKDI